MVKDRQGLLRRAEWDESLFMVASKLREVRPDRMMAIAGGLTDCGGRNLEHLHFFIFIL
jgi:predicted molibdopterin-dependent oxidoreductase YjgC